MIRFESVSKGFWVQGEFRAVIDNLSLIIPTGKSLALLGKNGAGKSTLLNMIAGYIRPEIGSIYTDGSVSWVVGYSKGFHKDLTGVQNTRFLARAYGVDSDELTAFVQEFSELGDHYSMPVRTYSSGMKSRLAFGISMGIRFDTYLIDEVTAVGDSRFKKKSYEVFKRRMTESSAVLVSHSSKDLRQFCDSGMVLHNGRVEYYEDLESAIARHEELSTSPLR